MDGFTYSAFNSCVPDYVQTSRSSAHIDRTSHSIYKFVL